MKSIAVCLAAFVLSTLPLPALAARNGLLLSALSGPGTIGVLRPGVVAQSAGGSLSLQLGQVQGQEAIDVQGQAPANAPVTITMLAIVSSDIPTIVVSRHDLVTDVNGRFGAVIPIASAYERGTLLRIVASSLPGIAPAAAQWIVNEPNPGVTVPLTHQ